MLVLPVLVQRHVADSPTAAIPHDCYIMYHSDCAMIERLPAAGHDYSTTCFYRSHYATFIPKIR